MPHYRRQARILAMQMLCQLEVHGEGAFDDLDDFLAEEEAGDDARVYAASLARDCWSRRTELDDRFSAATTHWSVERISTVERNIIRVAIAEMLGPDVPSKVAINEAIELGKEYGGAETPRFINGVLNGVYQRILEEEDHGTV